MSTLKRFRFFKYSRKNIAYFFLNSGGHIHINKVINPGGGMFYIEDTDIKMNACSDGAFPTAFVEGPTHLSKKRVKEIFKILSKL